MVHFRKKMLHFFSVLHPIQTLNKIEHKIQKKTGLDTYVLVFHLFHLFVVFVVSKNPKTQPAMYLEMLYPEVQNMNLGRLWMGVSHLWDMSQTGHLPQFWGVELLTKYQTKPPQNIWRTPSKSWKLQCFPMSSSPCAQSRISSNSWWLLKSPRGFWLRRWISSNNCIANKKSPRVSSRVSAETSKKRWTVLEAPKRGGETRPRTRGWSRFP